MVCACAQSLHRSRGGWNGPVWSPDGTRMAAIYEGTLAVFPVSRTGEPLGPPRHLTSEIAYAPSWAGDSRHILYQSNDKLRLLDIETGEARTVPLDLTYRVNVPKTHLCRACRQAGGWHFQDRPHRHGHRHRRQPHHRRRAACGRPRRNRGAATHRHAGTDRFPFPPPERSRRAAGPLVPGLRRHHGPQPRWLSL